MTEDSRQTQNEGSRIHVLIPKAAGIHRAPGRFHGMWGRLHAVRPIRADGRRSRRIEIVAIGSFKHCPRRNGRGSVSGCRMKAVGTLMISFAGLIASAILQPKEDQDEDGQDGKDGGEQRQQGAVPRDSPVSGTDAHEGAESGE